MLILDVIGLAPCKATSSKSVPAAIGPSLSVVKNLVHQRLSGTSEHTEYTDLSFTMLIVVQTSF